MIDNYNRARANDNYNLWCVYGSFSRAKEIAFDNIKNEMANNDGYGLYITTACKMFFTCAYVMEKDGEQFLVYHTPTARHQIKLLDGDII